MKIELHFNTVNEGKYLFRGEDISTAIWAMLDETMKYHPEEVHCKLIKTELDKQNDRHFWTWKRLTGECNLNSVW